MAGIKAPMPRKLSRLRSDQNGATIVEFGFVILPLTLILLAGMDFGHRMYTTSVMQGALTDAARAASVENPTFSGTGSFEAQVESAVEDKVKAIASKGFNLTVNQRNFYDFSGIGNPEKIVQDNNGNGEFDEDDGDCFSDLNENGTYDLDTGRSGRGGSNDVVFYDATLEMPAIVPLAQFIGGTSNYTLVAETAIRNQPWGAQATPPTICGSGA